MATIQLGEITVEVVQKEIKHIHLSVHPPDGRVRVAAPLRMDVETIRVFVIAKLDWIKKQQTRMRAQARETPREFLERESHFVWGKRYLLHVVEADAPPAVALEHTNMVLHVRPGTDTTGRRSIVDAWYRQQLKAAVPPLLARWEPILGVKAERFFVQRMKTRWGSCNPRDRHIRLNTELAKKPPECLEYVLVHELVHLLEPSHNARFVTLMDRFLAGWRHYRDQLNRLPISHTDWDY